MARAAAATGGFSVSEQDAPQNAPATTALRSVSSLDGLMAPQGIENPTERKKRAVAKGRKALDVLDDLKLGLLLDGSLDPSTMARLKVAADGLSEENRRSGPRRGDGRDRPAGRGGDRQGRYPGNPPWRFIRRSSVFARKSLNFHINQTGRHGADGYCPPRSGRIKPAGSGGDFDQYNKKTG